MYRFRNRSLATALSLGVTLAWIGFSGCGGNEGGSTTASFRVIGEGIDPMAISADGTMVVGTIFLEGDASRAFRWREDTGVVELGTLPGERWSAGSDVSADGGVIVGSSGRQGFRWTEKTGMVAVRGVAGEDTGVFGISADETVMVGVIGRRAALWDHRGVPRLLFPATDDYSSSQANAVTPDGRVVAGTYYSEGSQPFRWEAATGVVTLGDVPGGTGNNWVRAISGDGRVICGRTLLESVLFPMRNGVLLGCLAPTAPFCWDETTGMRTLPELPFDPSPRCQLIAFHPGLAGVNRNGSVVVGYIGEGGERDTAALWDVNGVHAIGDLLVERGIDLDGWQLLHADAVTPDGQTIVGVGLSPDGKTVGWIAVVPSREIW